MKAISLTQPWATLVAIGAKSIETRSWHTAHRGELAIHAAKKFPLECRHLCPTEPFNSVLGAEILHTGKIVAVATLDLCFRFNDRTVKMLDDRSRRGLLPKHETAFGDYAPGRYGFRLTNVVRLATPIECRGMLSIWQVPEDVEREIRAQLNAERLVAAVTA